ncbi:hypothetical protein SVAN01_04936 [Stagonosporopsis vannaccii]|nr:hypothetical protein SVAN01_04936 [Stagonosporopsis vannaccii]
MGPLESVKTLISAGGKFQRPCLSDDVIAHAVESHNEYNNRLPVIEFLLDQGADIDAFYDQNRNLEFPLGLELIVGKQTGLHLAIRKRDRQMVEMLVRRGADPGKLMWNYSTAFDALHGLAKGADWKKHIKRIDAIEYKTTAGAANENTTDRVRTKDLLRRKHISTLIPWLGQRLHAGASQHVPEEDEHDPEKKPGIDSRQDEGDGAAGPSGLSGSRPLLPALHERRSYRSAYPQEEPSVQSVFTALQLKPPEDESVRAVFAALQGCQSQVCRAQRRASPLPEAGGASRRLPGKTFNVTSSLCRQSPLIARGRVEAHHTYFASANVWNNAQYTVLHHAAHTAFFYRYKRNEVSLKDKIMALRDSGHVPDGLQVTQRQTKQTALIFHPPNCRWLLHMRRDSHTTHLPTMQTPTPIAIDRSSQAYKHPLHVDALENNFPAIRKLMKDLGMPDFPAGTSTRAMKLRYRLAHAGILDECERVHGSRRIDEQADKYRDTPEHVLRELCKFRGESTQGNVHELTWRANRTDLDIRKVDGSGYMLGKGPRRAASLLRQGLLKREKKETQPDRHGNEALEPSTQDSKPEPTDRARGVADATLQHQNDSAVAQAQHKTLPAATQSHVNTPDERRPSRRASPIRGSQSDEVTTPVWLRVWRKTASPFWTRTKTLTAWVGVKVIANHHLLHHLTISRIYRYTTRTVLFLWRCRGIIVLLTALLLPALKFLATHWPWLAPLYHALTPVLRYIWRCLVTLTHSPHAWTLLTSWWPALHQFGLDWWDDLSGMACALLGCPDCPPKHCAIVSGNENAWCEMRNGAAASA